LPVVNGTGDAPANEYANAASPFAKLSLQDFPASAEHAIFPSTETVMDTFEVFFAVNS
jgi:hypothetical protein